MIDFRCETHTKYWASTSISLAPATVVDTFSWVVRKSTPEVGLNLIISRLKPQHSLCSD